MGGQALLRSAPEIFSAIADALQGGLQSGSIFSSSFVLNSGALLLPNNLRAPHRVALGCGHLQQEYPACRWTVAGSNTSMLCTVNTYGRGIALSASVADGTGGRVPRLTTPFPGSAAASLLAVEIL